MRIRFIFYLIYLILFLIIKNKMRSTAGPAANNKHTELPSQLEISNTPLNNQSAINQNAYNHISPGIFDNNPNYPPNVQHQPNVIYVPQQVIVVEKKDHNQKKKKYPKLDQGIAVLILLLNVFFPGIGTMLIGCISGEDVGTWICIGIAQILLAWIIIGWVWAIITGVMILNHSD